MRNLICRPQIDKSRVMTRMASNEPKWRWVGRGEGLRRLSRHPLRPKDFGSFHTFKLEKALSKNWDGNPKFPAVWSVFMPTPHAYPKPSTQTQMSLSSNSGLHWIGAESKTSTAEMSIAPSLPRLHSSFICCPLKLSSPSPSLSHKFARNQRSPACYPRIRALDLDQNTVFSLSPTSFPVFFHFKAILYEIVKMWK